MYRLLRRIEPVKKKGRGGERSNIVKVIKRLINKENIETPVTELGT